jgi:hypothetical protein
LDFVHSLTERALRALIDRHGHALHPGALSWVGGIYGQVRQGYPLKDDQIAQLSLIRAELARLYRRRAGDPGRHPGGEAA